MATSAAQVCNIALLRVGQRQTINSLEDKTTEARACKAFYDDARKAVLESFAWPFAKLRATLAEHATEEREEWEYVYVVPADCIAPLYLYTGMVDPTPENRIEYQIEAFGTQGQDGRLLLTNQEEAVLVYTTDLEAVPRFSPLFVDCLAWKLASDLALAVPVKPGIAPKMLEMYERTLMRASAAQLNQQQAPAHPDAEWIRARG